jgi:hypothetical protein
MDGIGFYMGIFTSNEDHIPSLADLTFPLTAHTQETSNDLPSQFQDDVVEVQAAEVAGCRRAAKGASHRTKKIDKEEDKVICSAWLNVSKDPIHGASQTRLSFWGRIRAYFEEHKKTEAVRTENYIMHRSLTIQKDVNKFCSYYEKIECRNASGATIQDMVCFHSWFFYLFCNIWFICEDINILNILLVQINQALETYTGVDEDNKSFTLMHCWHRLKDEDKWKTKMIELAAQQNQPTKKKQKTTKDSTPSNVEDNNNDEVQEVAAQVLKNERGQRVRSRQKKLGREAATLALQLWTRCGRRRHMTGKEIRQEKLHLR